MGKYKLDKSVNKVFLKFPPPPPPPPLQVATSGPVKDLELDKRNCKFHSESAGLRIFREYTREACVFECQLESPTTK